MFRIVIFAGDKGVETTGQAVNGRVESRVVFVGEYYVEVAVELRCGELVELPADQCEADEVGLRALGRV